MQLPEMQQASSSTTPDGRSDFDFLLGRWSVRHRRLRVRLAGGTTWDEFDGACEAWPLLGGLGNVDDNVLNLPSGPYRAAALRAFDPSTRLWSIWWLDGRTPSALDVPVVGGFKDGTGTFLSDDVFEGKPIRVRFRWFDITPRTARWDQAFSADGGATWETNWVMAFERAPSPADGLTQLVERSLE